jgi:hypothetical protein
MINKPRIALALSFCFLLALLAPKLYAGDDEYATIRIVVLKRYNGKPLRNAAVVLHEVKKDGKQSRAGLELKTDSQGRASYEGVPYGKLRIQVIAPGFRTYGEDYDITQPEHEIVIKMQRPTEQYSIYDKDKQDSQEHEKPNQTKPDSPPKDLQ